MQGNREKMIPACTEFLTAWKNADPNLPEIRRARDSLAGLAGPPAGGRIIQGEI